MSDRQISAGTAFRTIMDSAGYLAIAAAVFLLLAAILPVATLSASMGGTEMPGLRSVGGGAVSATGASAGGALGWLALLAFVGSAAARFFSELVPFARRIDMAAFALLAAAVVWSVSDGPLATQMRAAGQVSHMFDGMAGTGGPAMPTLSVSILPSIGSLFVMLAPVALVLARRREAARPRVA